MKDLAKEYKQSIKLITERIKTLEDPDRIKPLKLLKKEALEVTKEIEHYFDKGWWRSEKYTLNARHSAPRYLYFGCVHDADGDECEEEGADETIFTFGYHICFDGQAKTSADDVL